MIELEYLSVGAYTVREGSVELGTVRKIGPTHWYAIRRGKRIGCGSNLRSGAVDILSAFASPSVSSSTSTSTSTSSSVSVSPSSEESL